MTTPRQVQAKTPVSPTGRTLWCGPFAAAVIARTDYDTAHDAAAAVCGKEYVKGMGVSAMWPTIHRLSDIYPDAREQYEGRGRPPGNWTGPNGEKATFEPDERPTLAAWLKTRDRTRVYLVQVSNHYLVVAGDKVIDNQMKEWTSVRSSKHRRRRVENVWRVASA